MRVVDDSVLALFRVGPCEWCGRSGPTDPHHALYKRGMGGGSRLDHRFNLVALCRGYHRGQWVSCHDEAEAGRITRADCLAVIAAREGVLQEEIEEELRRIRRLPKGSSA